MRFDVVTLFPDMFPGYLGQSLLKKAIEQQIVDVQTHDLRNWSIDDKHQSVDDRPFGGGPGMVLRVEPVVECVEALRADYQKGKPDPATNQATYQEKTHPENPSRAESEIVSRPDDHLILFTPGGRRLDQRVVESLARKQRIVMLCGRYEGFDQRVTDILKPDEISIGDFVLNGGEVAAMVLIDAVVRLLPGVLGDQRSHQDDSFSTGNRLLEGEQYTRPRTYRGHEVPDILLSGNHEKIAHWRKQRSLDRTRSRRSDLLNADGDGDAEK